MDIKICKCCNQELPLTDFYPSRGKKSKKGYRRATCKWCIAKKEKIAREENPEKYLKKRREVQTRWRRGHPLVPRYWKVTKGAERNFTRKEFEDWVKSQGVCCYYCGRKVEWNTQTINGREATFDHKDRGLPCTLSNLALCCRRCNMVKSKWLSEAKMLEVGKLLDA